MNMADTDLRIIRTKESIRRAWIQLIEEKGFEAITVKDITTRAGINRGTFYAHYQDKYDLMAKCQEEIMMELADTVRQNFAGLKENQYESVPSATPLAVSVALFRYLDENRDILRAVSGPKGDQTFQTKLKDFMWSALFVRKEIPLIKQENLLVPSQYLIAYIASAHMGVLQQWLNGDGEETPEEMARILSTLTVKGPFTAAGLKAEQVLPDAAAIPKEEQG
ncbi:MULTISPECIES: TetR/AcrR family transcriptional regulator C-terminal domain-containing protein [unclassified Paenibacillus]|uniref:TetR/AcrR family transcriptional regulator n=1 Tax=unclassified Paenibacillus TaxID=185978 RepID=UPI000955A3AC|nr:MULTISPECIES: TetR/AcrR family transcriptional regulator C-terminal domain-containing protein [unclassified Paenibacillus]ASS65361.1 TetR/AcrR family transcriptional regulator [Paenibacillus sp. RUD330]SIQ38730.1 transcriptional regulator, TetR family [Paenibacillus sp. RU4X]SIQ60920.1 transcriptional regulator, TetR family [Paenibacillus sp. RU4T]